LLKYLLGTGIPVLPAQDRAAQAVYLLPSSLVSQKGLDHAGSPTGIGLGWMHLLAPDDQSHIIEKTGGGAGFTTYIAINRPRRTAIFVAATDGPGDSHFRLFHAANDLLLTMAGLPPQPPETPKPVKKQVRRRQAR
jgi:serine-type D-Ala-D-Ala carboxypeptidase/endopeptidase